MRHLFPSGKGIWLAWLLLAPSLLGQTITYPYGGTRFQAIEYELRSTLWKGSGSGFTVEVAKSSALSDRFSLVKSVTIKFSGGMPDLRFDYTEFKALGKQTQLDGNTYINGYRAQKHIPIDDDTELQSDVVIELLEGVIWGYFSLNKVKVVTTQGCIKPLSETHSSAGQSDFSGHPFFNPVSCADV